jgi:hypothetical protein
VSNTGILLRQSVGGVAWQLGVWAEGVVVRWEQGAISLRAS